MFFSGILTSILCSSCCQVYVGTRGDMMLRGGVGGVERKTEDDFRERDEEKGELAFKVDQMRI